MLPLTIECTGTGSSWPSPSSTPPAHLYMTAAAMNTTDAIDTYDVLASELMLRRKHSGSTTHSTAATIARRSVSTAPSRPSALLPASASTIRSTDSTVSAATIRYVTMQP